MNIDQIMFDFFSEKGIVINSGSKRNIAYMEGNLKKLDVLNQLYVISKFHRTVMKNSKLYKYADKGRTGKFVEEKKVEIRKFKKFLEYIKVVDSKNEFKDMLIEDSKEYLVRAEKCIYEIQNSGYFDILKRSIRRREICLEDGYFDNLFEEDGKINIINADKSAYENVEMDAVYFLRKLKEKEYEFDYINLAQRFAEYEELDSCSINFILAALSYPNEFMKCCKKFRNLTYGYVEKGYKKILLKAEEKDGKCLI